MLLPQPRATQHSPRVVLLSVKNHHTTTPPPHHHHHTTTTPTGIDYIFWVKTTQQRPGKVGQSNTTIPPPHHPPGMITNQSHQIKQPKTMVVAPLRVTLLTLFSLTYFFHLVQCYGGIYFLCGKNCYIASNYG